MAPANIPEARTGAYLTATFRGRPPRRPFARELAALRSLVRLPTSAAAVTRLTFGRVDPPGRQSGDPHFRAGLLLRVRIQVAFAPNIE
jgi:hypothetical protein